ncbi:nitroreductase [Rhodococcus erythropolis]|nr:nitroreductase [Rhodococcus erythropolis]
MHIVSGQTRQDLSRALHEANKQGQVSPDFFWDEKAYRGAYGERRQEQGGIYYRNLGVARDDLDGRAAAGARNFSFFGAPHVAMLFMPTVGDGVRVAGDLGMYGQTFLLALAARGLGGVPQTVLGLYADTVRDVLGISPDLKLLYGISFGYPDLGAASNRTPMGRADLSESVTFHS